MAADSDSRPSFSPWRRWGIICNLVLLVVLVLAVVVMVNYLARECFLRFHVNTRAQIQLSPSTRSLLRSLTNQIAVTLYYDKEDPLYGPIKDLLGEYSLVNPRISVQTVDYTRDAGAAQKLKAKYKLTDATDKNLVLFDCRGKFRRVPGDALAKYALEEVPTEKHERVLQRKITGFIGETAFNQALLDVTTPKPLLACFLVGHGEHNLESGDQRLGYLKFASVLAQNDIRLAPLSLLGSNAVPADCNLLIIAGPTTAIRDVELQKIEAYLKEGGRLLVLFNANSLDEKAGLDRAIGLEKLLARWGVRVGDLIINDPDHSDPGSGDVVVSAFSTHPIVNPLLGARTGLDLIRPRPVGKLNSRSAEAADAPRVEAVAFSSPQAFEESDPKKEPHQFPFIVAVEKGAITGVITERATTRMVVAGDSLFLSNQEIDKLGNREFAGYVVGWLLERTHLLQGPGPRPLTSFKIVMTRAQLQSAEWVLLGGLPGAVLVFGGLVWLRRRR